MATWKQEVAAETIPLSGVNAVTASMRWNIESDADKTSPELAKTTVTVSGSLGVKGLKEIDRRLIDGINYVSGDMVTQVAYLRYEELWTANLETLGELRPMSKNYGIAPGIDELEINSEKWKIVRVLVGGLMDDEETGKAVPSKLILYLRK